MAVFVKELRAGGPMRSGAAQPKAAPAKSVDAAASEAAQGTSPAAAAAAANGAAAAAAAGQQAEKEAAAAAAAKKEVAAAGGSGHSIELKERFYAGAAGLCVCVNAAVQHVFATCAASRVRHNWLAASLTLVA